MASTGDISKALLDLLKGSNQGTPQGNRSPAQAYQEENDDLHLEIYEKERILSPRELHKWRKSLFSVYVGRLPTDVTVRELVQLFNEVAFPKDVFVVPNEGNISSYTYGFLRFATLAEAHKAVSCINGRILGNRHIVVELSSETRSNISDKKEVEKEFVCDANDRLLRKEYPTFRRRSLPDKQEDLVQSKLLQSIAKLKSDQASVVNTGCKDSQESNGPSFLDKLEEILKKVIKDVPGETTTRSTAYEGPVCTIPLEDTRQNSPEVTQSTTQSPGSLPINGEHHLPINSVYSYAKPVVNSIALLPDSIGLDMREDMRQNSLETPKSTRSPGSLPINGEHHLPINSVYSYAKPVVNSIPLPDSIGLDMREDMRQNSLETPKSTQSPGSLPINGEHHSPMNSVYSYAKPVVNSIPLPDSIGLDMREDMRQNSLETPKSTRSPGSLPINGEHHSPMNSVYSCVKPVDNSTTFLPGPIDLDHGITEPKSEQSMYKEEANYPVEAQQADSHPSTALPLTTKSNLSGDSRVQKLTLSEGQNDTKGSSLDPYMMSRMRDIPCQDIRFRSQETSPIGPRERSPVVNQVSRVSRTEQEPLINGDGSNREGFRSQETSPPAPSERSPVVNQVSRVSRTEQEPLINGDGSNREGFRSQETSPPAPSKRSPVVNQVSRVSRTEQEALINDDGSKHEGFRSQETSPIGASGISPVVNQVSRARMIEEALINVDCNNREEFRSQETSPIGASGISPVVNQVSRARMIEEALINVDCNNREVFRSGTSPSERSPVVNQVSRVSRTDAEMDAAACTPFSSKHNESPSIKSRNAQGTTPSSEMKEIKATNGTNGHVYSDLSFQKQISNNSNHGSGRHPENTQQLAPSNVTMSPGSIQGSTQRSQQHDGDVAELRVIGICPTAEERGNDTQTQVYTPELNGKKLSHSDYFDEEKDEDMEDISHQENPQQTPALEQNQPKDQREQLPSQLEQLSLKKRSLHELQSKLEGIIKENGRLHSALPDHYKDKKTSGMYPDKEMLNLEKSIHSYEVEYQREMEITVTRNAEHELLYEREKLSAAFDTNLQKELDLELKMEMLKNEIKLANMANRLLVFYQKRNDMQ